MWFIGHDELYAWARNRGCVVTDFNFTHTSALCCYIQLLNSQVTFTLKKSCPDYFLAYSDKQNEHGVNF